MQVTRKPRFKRPLSPRHLLVMLTLSLASGCGARAAETSDSQSHWLTCGQDDECGELSCMCQVCSSTCQSDSDCWDAMGTGSSRCQDVESLDCEGQPAHTKICLPDCAGERCLTLSAASNAAPAVPAGDSSSETLAANAQKLELASVPECPALAATGAAGPGMQTDLSNYTGLAVVNELSTGHITLVPESTTGSTVEVFGVPFDVSSVLPLGQRIKMELEVQQPDEAYNYLSVRDESGELLLLLYAGYDDFYQQGRFSDPQWFGATLELRMTCQSSLGDACFESQVQSNYETVFHGDDTIITDGSAYDPVSIGGNAFSVYSWAMGEFGGARRADCNPLIRQGRTLMFVLYRQPSTP